MDLARGALLIARTAYRDLDMDHYISQFDHMAMALRSRLSERTSGPEDILRAMNAYLFMELGFAGNTADYYDPRNSYLNEVLERKLGIPISLSLVYLEVGRRIGLELAGVSFPGHFLVRYCGAGRQLILDPFSGGARLGEQALAGRLERLREGGRIPQRPLSEFLLPAPKKSILERMLRNLKGIYLQQGEFDKCLNIIEYLLMLHPRDAAEIRDRAVLFEQLECHGAAASDYRYYLQLKPHAADAELIRERLCAVAERAARIH